MKARTNPLPDFPENLLEFQQMFPNETACIDYLIAVRWPEGFTCSKCGAVDEPYRVQTRPRSLKCRACLYETSVTAHTILHRTKTSLHVWFWAASLVATSTPGMSALEAQKKLGIPRYETAFQMLHKLRAGMARPAWDKIGTEYAVELDIAWIGGKHKGKGEAPPDGGRRPYRKTKKVPVVIAIEVIPGKPPATGATTRSGKPKTQKFYGGRVRLRQIPNKSAETIAKFAEDWIAPGAVILSDAGAEYALLEKLGYKHEPLALRGEPEAAEAWIPLVHLVIGNLKAWLIGTFHGVRKKHLQNYLNEYAFRFNRRFTRALSFRSLLGLSAEQEGPTYRALYDGEWHARENFGVEVPEGASGLTADDLV